MRFGIVTIVCVALIASMASFAGAELITGNLLVRLETVGTSPVTTVGTAVTSWNDQAALGGAENFTDLSNTNQRPTLVGGATPTGKDALAFDGSDDGLAYLGPDTDFAGATYTWFMVFKFDSPRGSTMYPRLLANETEKRLHWGSWVNCYPAGQKLYFASRNAAGTAMYSSAVDFSNTDSDWHILSGVWNGSASTLNGHGPGSVTGWLDITQQAPVLTGASGAPTDTHLSTSVGYNTLNGLHMDGLIAAALIYDTALSATDVHTVEAYLNGTYLVPEPSTLALLATGLIGLLAYAWRKRK